jgi:hypothetical protein
LFTQRLLREPERRARALALQFPQNDRLALPAIVFKPIRAKEGL